MQLAPDGYVSMCMLAIARLGSFKIEKRMERRRKKVNVTGQIIGGI
jgi:hypothetical protein